MVQAASLQANNVGKGTSDFEEVSVLLLAVFAMEFVDDAFGLVVLAISAKEALTIDADPAKIPVKILIPIKKVIDPLFEITLDCRNNPTLDPNKLMSRVYFRPTISDRNDQKKTPKNIPSGYAEVNKPNDELPKGIRKCCPRVGNKGDVMVNPNKGKKETANSTITDVGIFRAAAV